jgi:hypothetical protein
VEPEAKPLSAAFPAMFLKSMYMPLFFSESQLPFLVKN